MKPITINTRANVRVRYTSGPMNRLIGREGVTNGHRYAGMLTVVFDQGRERAAEYCNVWPSSLERIQKTRGL